MEQRERFVILAQSDRYTKKELCEHFEISRKTGHKWLKLTNVARASLEELLLDFQDYLRTSNHPIWNKTSKEALYVRGLAISLIIPMRPIVSS